jgi:hypothetical protein
MYAYQILTNVNTTCKDTSCVKLGQSLRVYFPAGNIKAENTELSFLKSRLMKI